jgi:RIO kinase 1
MAYIGDLDLPAPNLTETTLTYREARNVFDAIIADIERMLSVGRIHADLSAYNVLYWNHRAVLIDFPQAISPDENNEAWDIFRRDVARICEHFMRYGIRVHPRQLAKRIWMKHRIDPDIIPIDEWEEPAD